LTIENFELFNRESPPKKLFILTFNYNTVYSGRA